MSKLFYITTPEKTRELHNPWHALDLGSGKVMVCVDWRDDHHEAGWSDHPDVMRLPHPVYEPTLPLSDKHVEHLAGRFGICKGHCVHDVIKKAAAENQFMRLYAL